MKENNTCKYLRESGCCELLKFTLEDGAHYHSCFYPSSNDQCKKYEPK